MNTHRLRAVRKKCFGSTGAELPHRCPFAPCRGFRKNSLGDIPGFWAVLAEKERFWKNRAGYREKPKNGVCIRVFL